MKCKHENAEHLVAGDTWSWREDQPTLTALCEQFRCLDCGYWLSLGPATDDERTAVEVRAAEIAADGIGHSSVRWLEVDGWHMHSGWRRAGATRSRLTPHRFGELAGYLAHCIVQHDADGGGE